MKNKNNKDLDFITNVYPKSKEIFERWRKELPMVSGEENSVKKIGLLRIVEFKNLVNWSVQDNLYSSDYKRSEKLEMLVDKLEYLYQHEGADNIMPMLIRICTKGEKLFIKRNKREVGVNATNTRRAGRGHFVWFSWAIKLTDLEVKRVKEYFNL